MKKKRKKSWEFFMKTKKRWHVFHTPSDFYKKNYFLSVWIANLGVVPLFFICFLRDAPIFTFLFDLLVFVTRVLETIFYLLLVDLKNKPLVLSKTASPVKAFLLIAGCFSLYLPLTWAQNPEIDLILARGEQKELQIPGGIKKFSIGNSEVLAKKIIGSNLLIKGKSVGFSDLKIWGKSKNQIHYRIYVLSKNDQLTNLQLAHTLKELNLKLSVSGSLIKLSGELQQKSDYFLLQKITKLNKEQILDNVKLSKKLRSEIIGEIYESFYQENLNRFKCHDEYLKIICQISKNQPLSEAVKKVMQEKYSLEILSTRMDGNNYKIKLKLIQLEQLDGEELSLGLYQLSSRMEDFFSNGLVSLINKNVILLRNHHIHASTLGEPEIMTLFAEETKIEIGSEIPFRADALNAINTQWKFAGMRLKFMLIPDGKDFKLKYETEFTRPQEGTITGSKNQSIVNLKKDKPIEIFKVLFKTTTNEQTGVPLFEKIPILGELFKSKSNVETYKSINGLLMLEEVE
jgi:Flp pilus assembly secretin CpaC